MPNSAPRLVLPERKPLRAFRYHDLTALLSESVDGFMRHNAPQLGAALSFYALLSLAPLLLLLVSVVSLAVGSEAAVEGVVAQVGQLAGFAAAQATRALLTHPHSAANGIVATAVSIITLLFGASGVMVELRDALNTIWEIPVASHSGFRMVWAFFSQRLFSLALILAVGFLLVISLAVSAWIAALGAYSASFLPAHAIVWNVINFLLSVVVIAVLFAAIYKVLPYTPIEWYEVAIGGVITSILFTLGKFALGFYLGRATFASPYGAAASLVVLVAWVYYSAQIFFLGAEFTKAFADRYGPPRRQREIQVIPGS
jgi:membrane protein